MSVDLPDRLVELLKGPNPCFITTLMPDGSPQTTETWVDTDGEHVIINTVQTHQKLRNIQRDPRVSVAVCDAGDPSAIDDCNDPGDAFFLCGPRPYGSVRAALPGKCLPREMLQTVGLALPGIEVSNDLIR